MRDRFKTFNSGRAIFFLVGFIALVLAGAVLKITSPVVLPFMIAVLLAFVLEPLVVALEKFRIPRVFSILLVIAFIGGGIYLMGFILFSSARTILTLYPKYENRLSEIYGWVARVYNLPYDAHQSFFDNLWGQLGVRNAVRDWTIALSNGSLGFLTNAVMVLLFVVFLMLESAHISEKVDYAFEGKDSGRIKRIAADIVRQVSRYLSIKFFVSLATGVLVGLGLALVGMDFPIVWGVVSFVLNFIPNIGSIAAGVGVGIFSLMQFWPEPQPIVAALAVVVGANMAIGNVLEPKIQGDNLGLSPFVILVSLLAWGWLWGFAGLVLAVPMTVIVKIVCENVPVLEPVSIILGSYKAALHKRQAEEESSASPAEAAADGSSAGPEAPAAGETRHGIVDSDGSEL